MITLARFIEAWRDARIFKAPTVPRGFWWHALKYPQYGLWLASFFIYYTLMQWGALALVMLDISIAYFVFEYFLEEFRK